MTGKSQDVYPDFVRMAESFGVKARRVAAVDELRSAIREMLDTEGPFLLDVMVSYEAVASSS